MHSFIHSFIVGSKKATVSKTDKNTCLPRAYILVRTDNKINSILGSESAMEKNKARKQIQQGVKLELVTAFLKGLRIRDN